MKALAVLLLLIAPQGNALPSASYPLPAPACYGGELGCTAARVGHYSEGFCVAWFVEGVGDWEPVGYCVRLEDMVQGEDGTIADLWIGTKAARDAVWAKQMTRWPEPAEWHTWNMLLDPRPPSIYAVAPATGLSRPTYLVVDGVRSTAYNGRVATGAPCDCSLQIGSTCSVAGQPDLSRPGQALPENTVAICAKR